MADYFQPYEYMSMDSGDSDLGSSGTALLDGAVFRGTNGSGITRLAVVAGKPGKMYVLDANNLGGYRNGPGASGDGNPDATIQTIQLPGAVFGGVGSYPLEGGYIYVTPVGSNTFAYKLGHNAQGQPVFSLAGASAFVSAGRQGVGQMTVTSYKGQVGSGIVWVTNVDAPGLRAFRAVPDSTTGALIPIPLPVVPGAQKFLRPVFGDGRVYVITQDKVLRCYGSPVRPPLECVPAPIDFGSVPTGGQASVMVTCTANVAITKVNSCSTTDPPFKCSPSTLPPESLDPGASFSFHVTLDLSGTATPGAQTGVLTLSTTNGASGFATSVTLSLQGSAVFSGPYVVASASSVDFGHLVITPSAAELEGSVEVKNLGSSTLTLTGFARHDSVSGGPYTNITKVDGAANLDNGFRAIDFPPDVSSTLAPGESLSITFRFTASTPGSYATFLTIWSDGGAVTVGLTASAGNPPFAEFSVSDGAGGWDTTQPTHISFGHVLAGTSPRRQLRICNTGGSVLTIVISKPPGLPEIGAVNPAEDLTEGSKILPGACATGTVAVFAGVSQPNRPSRYIDGASWAINTDALDPVTFQPLGRQNIPIDATIVSVQVGPRLPPPNSDTARYQWLGCLQDTPATGRNLERQVNSGGLELTNTNGQCQTLCYNQGFSLAGTEFEKECWCGNVVRSPQTYTADELGKCSFGCLGNSSEACGGSGGYISIYADTERFDIPAFLASVKGTTTASSMMSTSTTSPSSISTSTSVVTTSSSLTSTSASSAPTSTSTAAPTSTSASTSTAAPTSTSVSSSTVALMSTSVSISTSTSASPTSLSTSTSSASTSTSTSISTSTLSSMSSSTSTSTSTSALSSSSTSTTTSTSTSSTVTTSAMPTSTVSPLNPAMPQRVGTDWEYIGCHIDTVHPRTLSSAFIANDGMTLEACALFCSQGNWVDNGPFNLFGTEFGRECFCGYTLDSSTLQSSESDCKDRCVGYGAGVGGPYCGGGARLSVYRNVARPDIPPPPAPVHVPLVGGYEWVGCQTEAQGGRALSGAGFATSAMTAELCASYCSSRYFTMMGLEYATECKSSHDRWLEEPLEIR